MSDFNNTENRGDQRNGAPQGKVVQIRDNVMLEKMEPASEWPDPDLSIRRLNRRPPPVLPLCVLGERWATWVEDAAASASAPVDYVVAPLLAAASALIGHSRWAQAWPGWKEPPHLWCASVGDSGDGKSPGADTILFHVLPAIERNMVADFPDTFREKQTEIEAAKLRLDAWKEEMRVAIKEGRGFPPQPDPVPREPIEPVLMMSDTRSSGWPPCSPQRHRRACC
jgi:Protein of unknown function (DUF3987)